MTPIFFGFAIFGLLVIVYFTYKVPQQKSLHESDDLLPIPAYTEDELVPDTWGIPKTQRHFRDLKGPAPCVRCREDNGNCEWVWPK